MRGTRVQGGLRHVLAAVEGESSDKNLPLPTDFPVLLKEIRTRIQEAQTLAMFAVNAQLVRLYWDIGPPKEHAVSRVPRACSVFALW